MASIQERPDRPKPYQVRWRESGEQRSRSFKRKMEARAFLRKAEGVEDAQRAGTWEAPPEALDRTVAEQYEVWLRTRTHLEEATRKLDRWAFGQWLLPALGGKRLRDVKPEHLEAILADVSEEGLSAGSRRAIYTRLNLLLDNAIGPERNRCRQVVAGSAARRRKPRPFVPADLQRLLECVREDWRLNVDTFASLGLRPQECMALQPEQIDATTGTVTIDRAVKGDERIGPTKNETVRTLPLPEHLAGPLIDLAARGGQWLWPWWSKPSVETWRVCVWKPAVRAAGLEDRVPYDLRHTCASLLISKGATIPDVAEWMGHSEQECLRTYAHLFPGRKAELAALLSR